MRCSCFREIDTLLAMDKYEEFMIKSSSLGKFGQAPKMGLRRMDSVQSVAILPAWRCEAVSSLPKCAQHMVP